MKAKYCILPVLLLASSPLLFSQVEDPYFSKLEGEYFKRLQTVADIVRFYEPVRSKGADELIRLFEEGDRNDFTAWMETHEKVDYDFVLSQPKDIPDYLRQRQVRLAETYTHRLIASASALAGDYLALAASEDAIKARGMVPVASKSKLLHAFEQISAACNKLESASDDYYNHPQAPRWP